jgi:hypothetical protein
VGTKKKTVTVLVAVGLALLLLVWVPTITDDYAWQGLGGAWRTRCPIQLFGRGDGGKRYPETVWLVSLARYVTFPGEAGWLVNFYGAVS